MSNQAPLTKVKFMFGTIKPKNGKCTKSQCREYRKYYCGLCFALGNRFGDLSRLFVNYDLTNDYLLAGVSCRDREEITDVCPWSIRRKKVTYYLIPDISDYFAKLNYIFVYYKLLDDINDENSIKAKFFSRHMTDHIDTFKNEMNLEITTLCSYLKVLKKIESENKHLPVFEVASLFGFALKNIVAPQTLSVEDTQIFAEINYWMGIWIYTMDAISDCLNDGLKNRYNPILSGLEGSPLFLLRARKTELIDILKMCRTNIIDLVNLYSVSEYRDLLINLFDGDLPQIVCLFLEVEKDVLKS